MVGSSRRSRAVGGAAVLRDAGREDAPTKRGARGHAQEAAGARGAERDGDRAHNHRVQGADRVIVAPIACDATYHSRSRGGRCRADVTFQAGVLEACPHAGATRREHPAGPATGHALTRTGANAVRKAPEMASIDRARACARQSGATP